MHAVGVVGELRCREAIGLHHLRIGMAALASIRDVRRMDRRAGITPGENVVRAMTVCTNRDVLVALGEFCAVDAGVIERQLVRTKGRIETLHAVPIRMAGTAQFSDLRTTDMSLKTTTGGFGARLIFRIAAVAGGAIHAFVPVDTGGRLLHDDFEFALQLGVTVDANVFR